MKQVIIIISSLKMGKGKICAQVAHASLEAYKDALIKSRDKVLMWEMEGQKKVVLKVKTKEELIEIYKKAEALGLPHAIIFDAGKTQLEKNTLTALAIGPYDDEIIDKLTGHLKLL